jgi:hypothetical protein
MSLNTFDRTGIFKATLKSWWHDNDGDRHTGNHYAYLRLYENGQIICRGGQPRFPNNEIDIADPQSFSLKGNYTIDGDQISLQLSKADGDDEKNNWLDTEMKYAGDVRSNDDFLKAGDYVGTIANDTLDLHNMEFQRQADTP